MSKETGLDFDLDLEDLKKNNLLNKKKKELRFYKK